MTQQNPATDINNSSACGVCSRLAGYFATVDEIDYSDCHHCDSIAVNKKTLEEFDGLKASRPYDASYWRTEQAAARERSFGSSLARAAEAILLATVPVERFLDIGSGAGYLLDALSIQLPGFSSHVYGVELFPPDNHSHHPNFISGSIHRLPHSFQAGVCIEVIEHLTPAMLTDLVAGLAKCSSPGALYVFNTGLSDYVRLEDKSYLDPFRRGHIISWGFPALRAIFEPYGFFLRPLARRNWAFIAEFQRDSGPPEPRVWCPLQQNKAILHDGTTGSIMFLLGRDSIRAV
jgi:hypothetical protein